MNNQAFSDWICQYRSEDSKLGGLSRIIQYSRLHSPENTLQAWENQFTSFCPCSDFVELLRMAWQLYCDKACSPDSSIKIEPYTHRRLKIVPPKLPNVWNDTPDLIHVRLKTGDMKDWDATYFHNSDYHVLTLSGRQFIKAVELFAEYFRREKNLNQSPYTKSMHKQLGDESVHPYLISGPPGNFEDQFILEPIGACVWTLAVDSTKWFLDWAWVHPFERSEPYFKKAWGFFQHKYGETMEASGFEKRLAA